MSAFRKMMTMLGLVDDDEYDSEVGYEETTAPAAGRSPARPAPEPADQSHPPETSMVRPLTPAGDNRGSAPSTSAGMASISSRPSVVRPLPSAPKPRTVTPKSFESVTEIGDALKAGTPVIVNLQDAERDLKRRIVDFASGLSFGLEADMERTADGVYLLTPAPRS